MRRAQGTLGLVVPRDFPNGALGPSGRTAERSGSGLGSRDSELQPCGCGQKARRNPCATLLTRCRPLSLRPRCPCGWGARRRVRARRYLGPLRDSTSTGRPARRSRCSLGSWSRCSTNATCRAPPAPLGPAQWDGPRTLPLGERARARARGPRWLRSFHPRSRARVELPGLHQARGRERWKGAGRSSATPTQFPEARGLPGRRAQSLAFQSPATGCVTLD